MEAGNGNWSSGSVSDPDFESFLESYLCQLRSQQAGTSGEQATVKLAGPPPGQGPTVLRQPEKLHDGAGYPQPSASPHVASSGIPAELAGTSGEVARAPAAPEGQNRPIPKERQLRRKSSIEVCVETNKRTRMQALDRNRKAQQRFRERQKAKMLTLEQQAEHLQTEVERLREEHTGLLSCNAILEKVLAIREEQLAALQAPAEVLRVMKQRDTDVERKCEAVREVARVLETTLDDDILDADDLKSMDPDAIIENWKNYIKELASLLLQLEDEQPPEGVRERIDSLVKEALVSAMRISMINPLLGATLVSCNMDAKMSEGLHDPNTQVHWVSVLQSVDLSAEQRQRVMQLRAAFVVQLQEITDSRRSINVELQASLLPPAPGDREIAARSLLAHTARKKLQENLQREHEAHLEFMSEMFIKVLTPLQVARASVHSYPMFPDPLAMSNVIASHLASDELESTT